MTRTRLLEAAGRVFIRRGFDAASVEEISEVAGYSRGAFYSNFGDKEQVLLAVIDRCRPQVGRALENVLKQNFEPGERVTAVRDWFVNQWRHKDLMTLWMEFSRRAMRDREVRKHLTELRRQELQLYADSVCRYAGDIEPSPHERPEIVALALLAVMHGLGGLAMDTEPEWEHMYAEAAKLVFDRLVRPEFTQDDVSAAASAEARRFSRDQVEAGTATIRSAVLESEPPTFDARANVSRAGYDRGVADTDLPRLPRIR